MSVRRIVTGNDADGRAMVASDGPAEELVVTAGGPLRIDDIWGADARLAVPSDGSKPAYERFFPPAEGFRVMVAHLEPSEAASIDRGAYVAERERVLVGYSEDAVVDPVEPELHATRTVDVVVVIEGEVTLRLDDGVEVIVGQGDYVVQNGTRHSWHNHSSARCSLLAFVAGADRTGAA